MATLSDLPDELLLEVFRHVQSNRDVVSLALQNRRLHGFCDLATRRKFRRIGVIPDKYEQAFHALICILKTPRLGEHVRHIELDCGASCTGPVFPKEELQEEDFELIGQAIENVGFVDDSEQQIVLERLFRDKRTVFTRSDVWHPMIETLAVLLLSVSPNVESLACCDIDYYQPKTRWTWEQPQLVLREVDNPGSRSFMGKFLDRVGREENSPYLRNLRKVDFLPDSDTFNDERFYNEQDYYHCLNVVRRLPALESVAFEAAQDSAQNRSIRPPPRCGNYSKIAFHHSAVGYNVLSPIIDSARHLKEFSMEIGGRASRPNRGLSLVTPDELLKSLLVHRDTLEYLDLDVETHVLLHELLNDESREYYFERLANNFERLVNDEDDPIGRERRIYEEEWADELRESALLQAQDRIDGANGPALSLRSFHRLKHLGIGIYTFFYLAQGIDDDRLGQNSYSKVSLVDNLPPNLESLRIYGYEPNHHDIDLESSGIDIPMDEHVSRMMEEIAVKIPSLKKVEGVAERIPNAETVDNPDEDQLWEREDRDWSDYEY